MFKYYCSKLGDLKLCATVSYIRRVHMPTHQSLSVCFPSKSQVQKFFLPGNSTLAHWNNYFNLHYWTIIQWQNSSLVYSLLMQLHRHHSVAQYSSLAEIKKQEILICCWKPLWDVCSRLLEQKFFDSPCSRRLCWLGRLCCFADWYIIL